MTGSRILIPWNKAGILKIHTFSLLTFIKLGRQLKHYKVSLCGYEGFNMNNGPQTGLLRCLSVAASSRNSRTAIGLKPKQWALMT